MRMRQARWWGDVAEVKAIKKVFTDMSHVKVNGTKSLIGHCLGAAGGLEAVATIQAIRTGWLHPTLNQVIYSSCSSLLLHTDSLEAVVV